MENIGIGLLLMLVGMCTVFLILLIVIWLSQFLISVVNKIAPEEAPKKSLSQADLLRMLEQWMLSKLLWIS